MSERSLCCWFPALRHQLGRQASLACMENSLWQAHVLNCHCRFPFGVQPSPVLNQRGHHNVNQQTFFNSDSSPCWRSLKHGDVCPSPAKKTLCTWRILWTVIGTFQSWFKCTKPRVDCCHLRRKETWKTLPRRQISLIRWQDTQWRIKQHRSNICVHAVSSRTRNHAT